MKRFFTLLFLFCFIQNSIAQKKAEEALQRFQESFPLEKIFIQYDKESYIAGEKMWFKCYVFSEYSFSNQSTNLYVELYNQQKQVLDRSIIPLLDGTGEGSFVLNGKLDEGVYYVRAYTTLMLNYDENFPYLHQFLVYNPQSPMQLKAKPIRWDAKAFAESGHLLGGTDNKVAIRLFSETFLPTSWKGVIKERDNEAKEVVQFTSYNEEVSAFNFTPEVNKAYVATITDNSGHVRTIPLPDVKSSGVVMKVDQQADTIVCNLVFKNQAAGDKFKLIGHMQNQVVCQAIITNWDSVVVVKLPARLLTDGIIHFTLFNSNEQPFAERLVFYHANNVVSPALHSDKLSFGQRQRNSWRIDIDSSTFHTYSMLVVDDDVPRTKDNMLSSLFLSNDITFKPSNSAWYFTSDSPLRQSALDALLVTEKWRWFSWENILSGIYPRKEYKESPYLSFTGTVLNGKKLQLNKDVNLLFQFRDSTVVFQQVSTDSSGAFQIDGALFEDTIKVFYKINSKKASAQNVKVNFELNNRFKRLVAPLPVGPYLLTPRKPGDSIASALKRRLETYQTQLIVDNQYKSLQEVVVKAKRKSATDQLNDSLSTGLFHRSNEMVFDFVNEDQHAHGFTNIMDWIRMRVPWASSGINYFNNIYIDEMRMSVEQAYILPVSDVAMVKVFRNFAGAYGNGRIIAIYTRRGYRSYPVGLPQGYIVGYKKNEPFIPFDYAADGFEQVKHDVREVLYWNTSLWPEKENASIGFYNNDVTKSYRVIVIGFTKDGQPVFLEKIVSSTKDTTQ